jgi:hypothetical protein
MRQLILQRIGYLWDYSPGDHGRWRPCAEYIAKRMDVDLETKKGRKTVNAIVLNSQTALTLDAILMDDELVELFEITVRRAYIQM